jgi:hypothetical protein
LAVRAGVSKLPSLIELSVVQVVAPATLRELKSDRLSRPSIEDAANAGIAGSPDGVSSRKRQTIADRWIAA